VGVMLETCMGFFKRKARPAPDHTIETKFSASWMTREPWFKSDGCKEGQDYGSIGVLTFVTGEVKQSSLRGAEYIPTCADVESITGTPKRARR